MAINAKQHKSESLRQLNQAVASKFENHFCYLTERLVVLALFSTASVYEKQGMAKAMKKYQNDTSFDHSVYRMPTVTAFTQLKDLIGPWSWVLFNLINKQTATIFVKNRLCCGRGTNATSGSNLDFNI